MTISFTIGKRFFKALHYSIKVLTIIIVIFGWLLPLAKEFFVWFNELRPGALRDKDWVLFLLTRIFDIIKLVVAFVLWKTKFAYSPPNEYAKYSSPKQDQEFFEVLPKHMFYVCCFVLLHILGDSLFGDGNMAKFLFENYISVTFPLSAMAAFLWSQEAYDKLFDKVWSDDSPETRLIIKHSSLQKGGKPDVLNTQDGLAHLKKGDIIKLIPPDYPLKEEYHVNVINDTPYGPVLINRIISKTLATKLRESYCGYMYGEIDEIRSLEHIVLSINKAAIPPPAILVKDDIDELFRDAAFLVVETQQGSMELIQRKLELGFDRASHIIDQLEATGILGPFQGSQPREVLIKSEEELKKRLDEIMKEEDEDLLGYN